MKRLPMKIYDPSKHPAPPPSPAPPPPPPDTHTHTHANAYKGIQTYKYRGIDRYKRTLANIKQDTL